MFSTIAPFIVMASFISVGCELDQNQRSAYEAAFKCTKAGWYADGNALEEEGKFVTAAEILEAGCTYSRKFTRCISKLDPAVFSSPVPNIAHFFVAFEWQHMILAEKAGLCTNMPVDDLRKIVLDSGILEKESLVNIEEDDYKQCAGDVMRKCIIDVENRMKQHVDPNFLTWIQHYLQCYEVIEATNICDVPIFRHFIGYVKAHEKYLKVKHGKFGKMVKGMSSPA